MPISIKANEPRKPIRLGIAGPQGKGKSTAIFNLAKNPLIFDLEKKLPPKSKGKGQVIDMKGRDGFNAIKQELVNIFNEPSLPYDWLVVDTGSKLEEHIESHAIQVDYEGKKSKYSAYHTGEKHELPQYFAEILDLLARIQDKHGINLLMVCHAGAKLQNNVMGKDYYKLVIDLKDAPMGKLLKWFDYLGFVWDDVNLDDEGLRVKALQSQRVISFDNSSPLFDAKSLKVLPAKIPFDEEGKWVETVFGKEQK